MDNEFVLLTDNGADLPGEYLADNGIPQMSLTYHLDNGDSNVDIREFYRRLRAGARSTSAQVPAQETKRFMEPHLKEGKDVLYIAFSSGLSGTCDGGMVAARELAEQYPDRRVMVVDSLCASLGQGLLVHLANRMKQAGKSIEEVARWVQDNRLKVVHWFTVDDLMYLHRGGRVSKASAIAGSMLGIKPVLHVDDAGHLIPMDKVRGRKQSLKALVDKMAKSVGRVRNDFFAVSHGDCEEDARYVAGLVSERFGIKDYMINFVGPVIGTHSGPGTIALFLLGEGR